MKTRGAALGFGLFSVLCLSAFTVGARAEVAARQITVATRGTDLFLGTDARGGVGDWYLSNGIVQAVVDDIGFQQDVLNATGGAVRLPITNEIAPSGGTLIDLGLVGKNNDQLVQVFQVANFNAGNPFIYIPASAALGNPALPSVLASVDEPHGVASLTVFGFVFIPGVSTPSSPTISTVTEYSVRNGENFVRMKTTVTNRGDAPVSLFSIVDAVLLGRRSNFPFAVFPGRGFNHPTLDLSNPLLAVGIFPYVSFVGRVGPRDGIIDTVARVPADEVSYTILSPSSGVLFGVNSDLISATGNPPVLALLQPGASRAYEREIILGGRNDVAASADAAIRRLGSVFRFPTGAVRGRIVAPDHLPFRASVEITQIDLNPLTPEPDTLLTPVTGDRSPLPLTQVLTDSELLGEFQAVLPVGIHELKVTAEERPAVGPIRFAVAPGSATDLGAIGLSAAGNVQIRVEPPGPAKITFKGASGTPDPNFGVPLTVTVGGVGVNSQADVSSPAMNVVFTATGQAETVIRPGTYTVHASRGIEFTVDSKIITVAPGETRPVRLEIHPAIDTEGYLAADLHFHGARSFDSSAPPRDRVISAAAEGLRVVVSTDHDFLIDYAPVIQELELTRQLVSMIGSETTTGGLPSTFGHFNSWPLTLMPDARRDGEPEDEFVEPNVIYDRLREQGAGTVQLNHPADPSFGLLHLIGFDPGLPITSPPNNFLLRAAITGSGTRNIDVDTFELYNGSEPIPQYVLSRQYWFNLLDQGIIKAGTAVSDSHRIVLEPPGFPRTYVASNTQDLRQFNPEEFNRNLKALKAFGTSGPFLTVKVLGGKALDTNGSDHDGASDFGRLIGLRRAGAVMLLIKVQAAPWIPVEEVRIFANGELVGRFPVEPSPRRKRFSEVVTITELTRDAYIVVEAGQVLPDDPTIQPPAIGLMNIIEPGVVSLAFSNPIFVDVDGNGQFDPPGLGPSSGAMAQLRREIERRGRREAEEWSSLRMTPDDAAHALEMLMERR